MIMYTPIKRNSTHVIVLSTAQYIAFMATPSTKFYIQLRNPSDRFISYVFHRQRFALEFKDVMLEQMTADYIDTFAKFATQNLTKCFQELGELGCFYTVADEDRMAMLLHSVYIIPLLEVFKFIPHHQVTLSTMEEYSSSRVSRDWDLLVYTDSVVAIFFLVHYINRDIVLVVHKNGNDRNIELWNDTSVDDNLDPITRSKRSSYRSRVNCSHRSRIRPAASKGALRDAHSTQVQVLEVGRITCKDKRFVQRRSSILYCRVVFRVVCNSNRSRDQSVVERSKSRQNHSWSSLLRGRNFSSLPAGVTCDFSTIVRPKNRIPNGCVSIPDLICN
ncbi:hypothetical protein EB796_025208 [Bugula neritina]|uniref:Uncharacterized protein n=1 Tax=Bugula neritina TaxID=10212 RepID=A0A7J7IRA3_BUGNE|nr:hypothetical protein EB796_025208 [Bugula neritina]